ncbi:hypothetical protein [Kineococcus glutinatus]|uniref:Uncharacterized protein n=1 Tax=Kineococcus glutinatus TaxID=1070872 RepID=A0ABP9HAH0_9ACTN
MDGAPAAARATISLVQPRGYVHTLALLDPALHLQHELRRRGVATRVVKNRLTAGEVNFVLGAHLGFDPRWCEEFDVVLVNLEQLGEGGAPVSPHYLRLLRENRVVDYDPAHREHLGPRGADVPLLRFGYAPHLATADPVPLDRRPLDLLFFGSVGERRTAVLERLRQAGARITVAPPAVYGTDRDELVRSARAVVNVSFYPTARFEQVRASVVLSCGTPLASERRDLRGEDVGPYADVVHWFDPQAPEEFVRYLRSAAFVADSRRMLARFAATPPSPVFDVLAGWCAPTGAPAEEPVPLRTAVRRHDAGALVRVCRQRRGAYRPGWVNVSPDPAAHPDWLVADVAPALPQVVDTARWGRCTVEPGSADIVSLGAVDPGSPSLPRLLGWAVDLLVEGGVVELTWPDAVPVEVLDRHLRDLWLREDSRHLLNLVHGAVLPGAEQDGAPPARLVLRKEASSPAHRSLGTAAGETFGSYAR